MGRLTAAKEEQQAPEGRGLKRAKVLIADDDKVLGKAIARTLCSMGFECRVVLNGNEAVDMMNSESFDLLVLDIHMPGASGWDVLAWMQLLPDRPYTVVLTGSPSVSDAVRALRQGADDYIEKPLDLEKLVSRFESFSTAREAETVTDNVVCNSPALARVFALARKVARSRGTSALIVGESGVGKEVLAEYIHSQSRRSRAAYVRLNLAALPASTIEGELFGSRRGAFTGANADRCGLIGSANGGTLLLDELCEFDLSLQPKLLRVLEERRYYQVGSDTPQEVDVRILAATNRDPQQAVRDGSLRMDLYYRLSAVTLRIPPLRERREDILPLARLFCRRFAENVDLESGALRLAPEAEARLLAHDWPGNVRELRNVIERAVLMCDGNVIQGNDVELEGFGESAPPSSMRLEAIKSHTVEVVERAHISRVLSLVGGSPSRAAEVLGVSRSTLWDKIRRYGIQDGSVADG